MFGGLHGEADLDDTWLFTVLTDTWSQLLAGAPKARDGHAMAYDSVAEAVVLFGGFDPETKLDSADTWIYGTSLD
jgi:hypothetical protein